LWKFSPTIEQDDEELWYEDYMLNYCLSIETVGQDWLIFLLIPPKRHEQKANNKALGRGKVRLCCAIFFLSLIKKMEFIGFVPRNSGRVA
jgi:hypothetical protein